MRTRYQQILEMIHNQTLAPGDRIKETDLSTTLNTSRIPVREAIKELEKDGVLEKVSPRITIVKPLSYEDMLNLSLCRERIEGLIAYQAAERIQNGTVNIDTLKEIHQQIADSIAGQDMAEFQRLDRLFHFHIAQLSGNHFAIQLLEKLYVNFERYRRSRKPSIERQNRAYKEHGDIIDTLEKMPPEYARNQMAHHIANAREIDGKQMQTQTTKKTH